MPKRARKRLRGIEELFRSIFENSQIGISFFDVDGRAVFTNRAFQDMLGYTEKDLNQLDKWDEIIHPDERVSGAERYTQLVQGKREKDEWEQRFIRRDGRIIVASARFTLIRDASGKPQYVASLTEDITQRTQAEEKLRASERLFRSIFEGAQIGIGVYKIDEHEHFSNRALHEMLDYTGEELSRLEQWDDIVPKDERDACAQRYAELVEGKRDKDEYEQHFIRRDGKLLLGNTRFQLLRDVVGKPQCIVALTEDITERQRAAEALRSSEQLFRTVFENAQIGIGILNIKTGEHLSNRAQTEMLGYRQNELSRIEQWDEIVHPDERVTGARRYGDLVQGLRDSDEYTQRFIRRDGQIVTGTGKFTLIRDSEGAPHYIIALHEDITERLKAEQALAASERLFRTIFENAQIGISFYNIDKKEMIPNRALQEMLGYNERELSRLETWDEITHPDVRATNAKRYAELVQGVRDKDEWEQRSFRRDGRIVTTSIRFSVLRDTAGRPQYVAALQEDITEQRKAEADILAAKEAAVAATKAKSEFLANMSHEIRTPMNAVLGMTHLALKTDLTPKQRDYLTKSKAAAETLLGIINDILDFSKIEAGKLKMERTEFRLDDVFDNLSTVVSHRAQEKRLEFLVAAGKELPDVLIGDPLRLGQVLTNLANNAVKFTERGEIVVSVEFEETVSDRIKLKFAVRDSGVGLTPDQSARLFQAFSQADTSTTRKHGGTGLGLSISKRLVEMMGGNIWVESEYGRGSTFCFTAWFGVGTAVRREKVFPPGLAGIRALVVDDNAAAREMLSEMLRQFAFNVECVSSGDEALRELVKADSSDPYQIVLMDWQMPGMDGLETSRRIKRTGNLRNSPKILMITAFDREDIRLQAQEMQIEGFLLKPVSPSVLFDTLMSLYGYAGGERATVSAGKVDRDSPLVSGIRVLLVEDNEVNQQVATELLESEGAKVTIANHGGEVVRILTQTGEPVPYDVVLMDLQMPEMDGIAATRLLRVQPHLKNLPIIAMTAHVMAEEVQRCLDAGMNDHVAKPIDPDSFFATLARWTRAHQTEVQYASAKTTRAEDEISLPELGGVDIAVGLRRVGGNRRLYRELLEQFAEKQKSAGDRIAAAFESGDRNQAERLAHSLKGVAGNLGIDRIFHSAGNLEKAIRESQNGVNEMIKELTSELDRQVQTIQERLTVASEIPRKGDGLQAADPVAVSKALTRLGDLLKASDADAREAYTGLAELLQGRVDPLRLQALSAAVRAFNFETALVELNEIAKQLGS